jgi:hypothetical protein
MSSHLLHTATDKSALAPINAATPIDGIFHSSDSAAQRSWSIDLRRSDDLEDLIMFELMFIATVGRLAKKRNKWQKLIEDQRGTGFLRFSRIAEVGDLHY